MARAAKALGYRYIAITDHSPSQTVADGLSVERLRQRREEIEAARTAVSGIAILDATEVDIKRDGSLDYPDEALAELDFVVASVHSGWKMERAAMTERIVKAMENPWVDCIGHPTGRLIGQREPYEVDMEAVLSAAARLGVAMEINAYPDRLDLKDAHARRAKELGVKLMINTDAHSADQLELVRFGVATARRVTTAACAAAREVAPARWTGTRHVAAARWAAKREVSAAGRAAKREVSAAGRAAKCGVSAAGRAAKREVGAAGQAATRHLLRRSHYSWGGKESG
jgi:histidinol phosphatase-like PHP family hydrolase